MNNNKPWYRIWAQKRRTFIVYFTCALLILIFVPSKNTFSQNMLDTKDNKAELNELNVSILVWNNLERYITKKFKYNVHDGRCEYSNCVMSNNLTNAAQADIIIFQLRPLDWSNIPINRSEHQIYVLFESETPDRLGGLRGKLETPGKRDYFNWTMGHRRDSEIQLPVYNFYERTTKNETEFQLLMGNLEKIVKNKTKMAAQFVSQCRQPSQRERLTKELQKYVEVDIFGRCGNKTCGGTLGNENHNPKSFKHCDQMLTTDYKFYLAFENSVCKDYITEKFLRPLRYFAIPIVIRGSDYTVTGAPKNSYIAADSFETVEDLANYLQYLNSNDTAYLEYFSWHKDYTIDSPEGNNNLLCKACKQYNEWVQKGSQRIIYNDMKQWFFNEATNCAPGYAGLLTEKKKNAATKSV